MQCLKEVNKVGGRASLTDPTHIVDTLVGLQITLEEILSISTGLVTRPSRLTPKKCINKLIWLATGGAPSMGTPRVPSGCQQIDLFMHFLVARVAMALVEMDKISSSVIVSRLRTRALRPQLNDDGLSTRS